MLGDMMPYCLKQAAKLSLDTHPVRCFAIVQDKRGNILGEGSNSYAKGSIWQARIAKRVGKEHSVFLHAECSALTRCLRSKSKAKPYSITVVRVGRNGESRNSKPCPICEVAIQQSGIKQVTFSI